MSTKQCFLPDPLVAACSSSRILPIQRPHHQHRATTKPWMWLLPTTFSLMPLSCTLSRNTHLLLFGLSFPLLSLSPGFLPRLSLNRLQNTEGGAWQKIPFLPFSSKTLRASEDVLTTHSYLDRVATLDHLANARDAGVCPTVPLWGYLSEILSLRHNHASLLDGEVGWRCPWDGAPQVQAFPLIQTCGGRFQLWLGKQLWKKNSEWEWGEMFLGTGPKAHLWRGLRPSCFWQNHFPTSCTKFSFASHVPDDHTIEEPGFILHLGFQWQVCLPH